MDPMDPHRDDGARSAGERVAGLAFITLVAAYFAIVAVVGWQTFGDRPDATAAEKPVAVVVTIAGSSPLGSRGNVTGVEMVDDALRGFLRGDVETALAGLVFQQISCGTLPSQGEPVLPCIDGQRPGSTSEQFLTGCDPAWVTADSARTRIGKLVADVPDLYAVGTEGAGYRAILSWLDTPQLSLVLHISSDGVTSFQSGCDAPEDVDIARPINW